LTFSYDRCNIALNITFVIWRRFVLNPVIEKISDAEAEIMKIVWDSTGPVTYAHIRTKLTQQGGSWESPTINTLVNRLVKKGALVQEKREVFYYSTTVKESEYMEAKTKDFIQKIYGGSAKSLVSAMLNNDILSEDDMDDLKNYWQKRRDKK